MPILAVSSRGDGQSILQALRAGAKEFLTAPVVLEELLLALQRLRANRASNNGGGNDTNHTLNGTTRAESMVISVVGSKGGVGCTSVAVNMSVCIAQDPKCNVALVDLDLALGTPTLPSI